MDKQTALRILQLDGGALKQDAKKAYRRLAKLYHPDVIKENKDTVSYPAGSMGDINLAFDFLLPLLPDRSDETAAAGQESAQEKSAEKQQKNSDSPRFFKRLQHLFEAVFRVRSNVRPGKARSHSRPSPQGKPDRHSFNDIFVKACSSNPADNRQKKNPFKKAGKRKPVSSGNRYCRYWALKKKMKSARPSKEGFGRIGRVEKVTPVRPVDPVRRNG